MATVKKIKKAQGGDTLRTKDLAALAHQKRGMGSLSSSFVKKAGPIKNETGTLTPFQKKQLAEYMNKAGTARKMYEALPNVGRVVGKSAADIPKDSKLQKQKSGGKTMLKRADGSVSQRGLWDNLRANKGSGKKPTAQMLKQERKIKSQSKNK
jgi:hypothetical protein